MPVTDLALCCEDKILVSGSKDNTVCLWDWEEMLPYGPLPTLRGHTSIITCLLGMGGVLASGSKDCTVRVWDIKNGKPTPVAILRSESPVTCMADMGQGQLAVGWASGEVWIWSMVGPSSSTKPLVLLAHSHCPVIALVVPPLSAGPAALVSAGGSSCSVWGRAGNLLATFDGSPCHLTCLALFAPPHSSNLPVILASGDTAGTVRLWSLEGGYEALAPIQAHLGSVRSVRFFTAEERGWLLTAGEDGKAKLWDGGGLGLEGGATALPAPFFGCATPRAEFSVTTKSTGAHGKEPFLPPTVWAADSLGLGRVVCCLEAGAAVFVSNGFLSHLEHSFPLPGISAFSLLPSARGFAVGLLDGTVHQFLQTLQ